MLLRISAAKICIPLLHWGERIRICRGQLPIGGANDAAGHLSNFPYHQEVPKFGTPALQGFSEHLLAQRSLNMIRKQQG
ncbi:hypothetical protein POUND7_007352 [Theobroma cacao]